MRANTFAYQSRKFCRACNSGWMNEVDQAARPVLRRLALDQPMALSQAEQSALALWTTKTVLGLLSIEPEEYRFAPPTLYQALHRAGAPLPGSQVWLGAHPPRAPAPLPQSRAAPAGGGGRLRPGPDLGGGASGLGAGHCARSAFRAGRCPGGRCGGRQIGASRARSRAATRLAGAARGWPS